MQERDDIDEVIVNIPVSAPCIIVMEASEENTYDVVDGSSLVVWCSQQTNSQHGLTFSVLTLCLKFNIHQNFFLFSVYVKGQTL